MNLSDEELAELEELAMRADEIEQRIAKGGPGILTISAPALLRLADTARNADRTDAELDDVIWAARAAGHDWQEIEPVLHACKVGTPIR